jgi:hypothetical protein
LPNWSALAISRLLTQCKIVACCRITASFPFPIGLGRANIQSACMRPHIQIYNQLVGETKLNSNTIEAPLAKVHAQCRRVRADCTTRFPDTRSRNMIRLAATFHSSFIQAYNGGQVIFSPPGGTTYWSQIETNANETDRNSHVHGI